MKYIDWFNEHAIKHKKIVDSISHLEKDEIIEYFDYESMRLKHPDFCPLFKSNTKCHEMTKLNCYLCGCPYFRFDDKGLDKIEGKIIYSRCIKGLGNEFINGNTIHQDCSKCTLPHTKKFISDNFDMDWSVIMKDVMP